MIEISLGQSYIVRNAQPNGIAESAFFRDEDDNQVGLVNLSPEIVECVRTRFITTGEFRVNVCTQFEVNHLKQSLEVGYDLNLNRFSNYEIIALGESIYESEWNSDDFDVDDLEAKWKQRIGAEACIDASDYVEQVLGLMKQETTYGISDGIFIEECNK